MVAISLYLFGNCWRAYYTHNNNKMSSFFPFYLLSVFISRFSDLLRSFWGNGIILCSYTRVTRKAKPKHNHENCNKESHIALRTQSAQIIREVFMFCVLITLECIPSLTMPHLHTLTLTTISWSISLRLFQSYSKRTKFSKSAELWHTALTKYFVINILILCRVGLRWYKLLGWDLYALSLLEA